MTAWCASPARAFHRGNVETAITRVAFDVATRMNIKGGTDKPTLPFRERLGCSPSEACVALGVGRTFLYKLIAEHRIEVSKLGRRTIVSIPSLLKLLNEQAAEPKPRRPGRPRKTDGLVAS
jgi:excisionase family DNA binding protein